MPRLAAILVLLGAAVTVTACAGRERVMAGLQEQGCKVRAYFGDPCPAAPIPQVERYCYRTLASVECYADEIKFSQDPAWQRSPPPDLAR